MSVEEEDGNLSGKLEGSREGKWKGMREVN